MLEPKLINCVSKWMPSLFWVKCCFFVCRVDGAVYFDFLFVVVPNSSFDVHGPSFLEKFFEFHAVMLRVVIYLVCPIFRLLVYAVY